MTATPPPEQPQPNHRNLDQKIIRLMWDGHEKQIVVEDSPKNEMWANWEMPENCAGEDHPETEMPLFDNIFSPTAENYIINYIDSL